MPFVCSTGDGLCNSDPRGKSRLAVHSLEASSAGKPGVEKRYTSGGVQTVSAAVQ